MSDREIRDRFDAADKRLDRMVTTDTWAMGNDHLREKIAEVDKDSRERDGDMQKATDARFKRIEDRGQNAWVRILGVLGIAATLAAAVWAAYLSSRGAH
jgi:hypothetical protein